MAGVSRSEAKRIAERILANDDTYDGISEVFSWNEIPYRKPLMYPADAPGNCWIAYASRRNPFVLT